MAQQVEHVLGKDEVAGSNPANSSKKFCRILSKDKMRHFSCSVLNNVFIYIRWEILSDEI